MPVGCHTSYLPARFTTTHFWTCSSHVAHTVRLHSGSPHAIHHVITVSAILGSRSPPAGWSVIVYCTFTAHFLVHGSGSWFTCHTTALHVHCTSGTHYRSTCTLHTAGFTPTHGFTHHTAHHTPGSTHIHRTLPAGLHGSSHVPVGSTGSLPPPHGSTLPGWIYVHYLGYRFHTGSSTFTFTILTGYVLIPRLFAPRFTHLHTTAQFATFAYGYTRILPHHTVHVTPRLVLLVTVYHLPDSHLVYHLHTTHHTHLGSPFRSFTLVAPVLLPAVAPHVLPLHGLVTGCLLLHKFTLRFTPRLVPLPMVHVLLYHCGSVHTYHSGLVLDFHWFTFGYRSRMHGCSYCLRCLRSGSLDTVWSYTH